MSEKMCFRAQLVKKAGATIIDRMDTTLMNHQSGSCGSWGGSAGIIEVEDGKILRCFNFRYGDEEELK